MLKVFFDIDGQNLIGFDVYMVEELVEDIIEFVLWGIWMQFGLGVFEVVECGEFFFLFEDEGNGMQVVCWIVCVIIWCNDLFGLIFIFGIFMYGVDCFCLKEM